MENQVEMKEEIKVKTTKKSASKTSKTKNPYLVNNVHIKRKGAEKGTVEFEFFEKLDQLGEELGKMPEKLGLSTTQLVIEAFLSFKADKAFMDNLKSKYECKVTRANMWLRGYNILREKDGLVPIKMTEFQVDVQPTLKKSDYDRFLKIAQESSDFDGGLVQ